MYWIFPGMITPFSLLHLWFPYTFRDWKNILVLVTLFTVGHTMALILSVYGVVVLRNDNLVELLLLLTILATALYNFFRTNKTSKTEGITGLAFTTVFFGIIHGFGFARYFRTILSTQTKDKLTPLLEFALGVEGAHLIIAVGVLILSAITQNVLHLSKRDWVLVTSSFVLGVVVPMIINNEIW